MAIHPVPARLLARLAIAGALALGLAGGVASVASAAPAPVDDGRIAGPSAPSGGLVDIGPVPAPTVPERPDRVVDPQNPCDDDPEGCKPDVCDPKQKVLPHECRPDPCRQGGTDPGGRCTDPCSGRRGQERPERCRPEPCVDRDDKDNDKDDNDPDRADRIRRHPEPRCPGPKGCDDPSRCDRPVPGKPTFTG